MWLNKGHEFDLVAERIVSLLFLEPEHLEKYFMKNLKKS